MDLRLKKEAERLISHSDEMTLNRLCPQGKKFGLTTSSSSYSDGRSASPLVCVYGSE